MVFCPKSGGDIELVKKIFLNRGLLIGGCICCSMSILLALLMALWMRSREQQLGVVLFFVFCAVTMFVGGLLCMPRWYAYVQITDNQVKYKCAFKKAEYIPLSNYRYLYKADYFHRAIIPIGCRHVYVVLSTGKVSDYDLSHINQVAPSLSLIKMRYSKKIFDRLLECLNEKQKRKLLYAFENQNS